MPHFKERYAIFREGYTWGAILFSSAFFGASILTNAYAEAFATERASNSVTDIILSNTPVFPVGDVFVYGAMVLIGFVFALCLLQPKHMAFTFSTLGLFLFTRSLFVTLTHLGPYPTHEILDFESKIIVGTFGGGDYFFSGHTGIPFLLALIYWYDKRLRVLFLLWSVFFAGVVLLGHLHYSIDVLSAFFITYTIYHMALKLFPKEKALFDR